MKKLVLFLFFLGFVLSAYSATWERVYKKNKWGDVDGNTSLVQVSTGVVNKNGSSKSVTTCLNLSSNNPCSLCIVGFDDYIFPVILYEDEFVSMSFRTGDRIETLSWMTMACSNFQDPSSFAVVFLDMVFPSKNISNIGYLDDSNSDKGCFKVIKNNDERHKNKKKIILNLKILIITSICVIIECAVDIINPLSIFNYWIFILLIISYINAKMFKLETYKHQKIAIYFSFIIAFIFQLSSFIIKYSNFDMIYKKYSDWWVFALGLIIHFLYASISSYTYSKMKWFMDLKQISLPKLFMIYSVLGLFINIIFCLILTKIKCNQDVGTYFCSVNDIENNLYVENIQAFYYDISIIFNEHKNYIIHIIIIFCADVISDCLFVFCFLSILKNLTPEFYFFIGCITEILYELINIFQNKIKDDYFFSKNKEESEILIKQFILLIIGNSLAFIGFLVYLEIIELNFCNLDYNIRRKIIERSLLESIQRTSINEGEDEDQNESLIDDNNNNTSSTELSNNGMNSVN